MKGRKMFLVPIHRDLRIQRIVVRPIEIYIFDENGRVIDVELIQKSAIVCDVCGTETVALTENEVQNGLRPGYAVCDSKYVIQITCDACRSKYFSFLKIYNDLDEALGAEE